jgi:hypothetical protein
VGKEKRLSKRQLRREYVAANIPIVDRIKFFFVKWTVITVIVVLAILAVRGR